MNTNKDETFVSIRVYSWFEMLCVHSRLILSIRAYSRLFSRMRQPLVKLGLCGVLLLPDIFFAAEFNPDGWRLVQPGYHFEFPRDHGPHFDYQTEWWYLTGNLRSTDGREFGYELTFFRYGYRSPAKRLSVRSRFVMNDIKFAHFTITDIAQKKFYASQRISRGAYHDAGFLSGFKLVWISDWELDLDAGFKIAAADGEQEIQLSLQPQKQPVLQGKDGFSQKAAGDGHASDYYSITRLDTKGTLRVGGTTYQVTGLSWFDREWATNQLAPDQAGWNWFAIQLSDGTDLMLYQMRLKNGGIDPYSTGKLVSAVGAATDVHDFVLVPMAYWTSPTTHARYPIAWHLRVPQSQTDLEITTPVPDQELNLSVTYWEGAIRVNGTRGGNAVHGVGYLELTGYGSVPPGSANGMEDHANSG
jgi:predicted secreted hydrolase